MTATMSAPRRGLASYDAKRKQNWRGWQWNRIVERLTGSPEKATVLYLCGPNDVDRDKALARGFRNENLIAIDLSEANVRAVRAAGGFGIAHDLAEVLVAWPREWPVDVVVADFCAGLDRGTVALLNAMTESPAIGNAVLAVNLQRGRDAISNCLRADMAEQGCTDDRSVHRGKQLEVLVFTLVLAHLRAHGIESKRADTLTACILDAAHNSYKSNRVTMDSVVLGWASSLPCVAEPSLAARRKIAALRAMRTSWLQRQAVR